MEQLQKSKYKLTTVYGLLLMDAKDISYVQGQNNYALLKDVLAKDHFICQSLKEMEDVLCPHTFLRVHRSYVVNTNQIYQFHKKGEGRLVLRCGAKIPIGRTYRTKLLDRFNLAKGK